MISALNQEKFTSHWQASTKGEISLSYLQFETLRAPIATNHLFHRKSPLSWAQKDDSAKMPPRLCITFWESLWEGLNAWSGIRVYTRNGTHTLRADKGDKVKQSATTSSGWQHHLTFQRISKKKVWGKREHQGNNNFPRYFCSRLLSTILSILNLSETPILFKSIDMGRLNNCWTAKFPNSGVRHH